MSIALLIKKITSMDETYFTKTIVMPLLEAMKYEKVEYHGGTDENGKDVICWEQDKFGDKIVTTVQVKRVAASKAASSRDSIMEIIIQISQYISKELVDSDGNIFLPSKVIFITPYEIDTKTLLKECENIKKLREYNGIKIIDGRMLIDFIDKYKPDLKQIILGEKQNITTAISKLLNNQELLYAMQTREGVEISDFFLDLLFHPSNKNNSTFLFSDLIPFNEVLTLDNSEWDKVKKFAKTILDKYNINILSENIEEIENNHIILLNTNTKLSKEIDILDEILHRKENESKNIREQIVKIEENDKTIIELKNKMIESKNLYGNNAQPLIKDYNTQIYDRLHLVHPKEIGELERLEVEIKKLKKDIAILNAEIKDEKYNVQVNGQSLIDVMNKIKNLLKDAIAKINNNEKNMKEIKQGIKSLKANHQDLDLVCSQYFIKDIIKTRHELVKSHKDFIINIPIHSFFKTRENMVLIGDAGAGKTTTLQMYAKIMVENSADCCLYINLVRLIQHWSSLSNLLNTKNIPDFFEGLHCYLMSIKEASKLTDTEFKKILQEETVTLLLDGLDEIIKANPFIIRSIQNFEKIYPNIQLIVTCRISSEAYKKLSFLTLKLLPFTDSQRNEFFTKWFYKQDSNYAKEIIEHLNKNKELSQLVCNPLLATILCILKNFNIPLPNTEIRLYDERFKLLTGKYDFHKKIKRVSSYEDNLYKAMCKIAYYLHSNNTRYSSKKKLIDVVLSELKKEGVTDDLASTIVYELCDPCNILELMTDNEEYGFGHLRFQEYLVACEFAKNRSIEISNYVGSSWWQGPLVLFSYMEDHLDWFITKIESRGIQYSLVKDTLLEMIKYRSKEEQDEITNSIKKNIKYQEFENEFS